MIGDDDVSILLYYIEIRHHKKTCVISHIEYDIKKIEGKKTGMGDKYEKMIFYFLLSYTWNAVRENKNKFKKTENKKYLN